MVIALACCCSFAYFDSIVLIRKLLCIKASAKCICNNHFHFWTNYPFKNDDSHPTRPHLPFHDWQQPSTPHFSRPFHHHSTPSLHPRSCAGDRSTREPFWPAGVNGTRVKLTVPCTQQWLHTLPDLMLKAFLQKHFKIHLELWNQTIYISGTFIYIHIHISGKHADLFLEAYHCLPTSGLMPGPTWYVYKWLLKIHFSMEELNSICTFRSLLLCSTASRLCFSRGRVCQI